MVFVSVAVAAKITGTNGNDYLPGTRFQDHIAGGAGADRIEGFKRGDFLHGDSGEDTILGQRGGDKLYAGNGNVDRLRGDGGDDILNARDSQGRDVLRGGAGFDECVGDVGDTFSECEFTRPIG